MADWPVYIAVSMDGIIGNFVSATEIHPMIEDSENDVYEANRQEAHDDRQEQQTPVTWESQWFISYFFEPSSIFFL